MSEKKIPKYLEYDKNGFLSYVKIETKDDCFLAKYNGLSFNKEIIDHAGLVFVYVHIEIEGFPKTKLRISVDKIKELDLTYNNHREQEMKYAVPLNCFDIKSKDEKLFFKKAEAVIREIKSRYAKR